MSPSSLLAFCMIQHPRLGGFVCLPETVSCQFRPQTQTRKSVGRAGCPGSLGGGGCREPAARGPSWSDTSLMTKATCSYCKSPGETHDSRQGCTFAAFKPRKYRRSQNFLLAVGPSKPVVLE